MTVALLLLLPVSAQAGGYTDYPDAKIVAVHKKMSADNASVTNGNIGSQVLGDATLSPPYNVSSDPFTREDSNINVWVTSSNMTREEKTNYSVIPYVIDKDNNCWYLYQIMWANYTSVTEGVTSEVFMTHEDISSAENSLDYQFDLTEITAEPYSSDNIKYSIMYCWTTTPPEDWGVSPTEKEIYTINYSTNIENVSIYGYTGDTWDGGDNGINLENGNKIVTNPYNSTVTEDLTFTIGDKYYQTYFAVRKDAEKYTYYSFAGWKDKDDNLHQPGTQVAAYSSLADDNNCEIILTAQWEEIETLDESLLEIYSSKLPITVFSSDSNVADSVLITQWTDTDENMKVDRYTGGNVTLDEEGTIYYRVSAKIDSGLTGVSDENQMNYDKSFAEIIFHISVDGNLEFAELDEGKVTLTFESTVLEPIGVTLDDDNRAAIAKNAEGSYSITFDPTLIPLDAEMNMNIEITTQWVAGMHTSAELRMPILMTGLQFKLKNEVANKEGFAVKTSANITGTMDMKNKVPANFRAYYRAAFSLLRQSDKWQEVLGQASDPIALIKAIQYMDYKLNNIDLENNATFGSLTANTVTATYPKTIAIKPVNMTIYMGGSGGYDAVVNESGEQISSNSLPHPLFTVDAPDGINHDNLTFTNGEKSWNLISDGNGYYHFSEEASKVRVTYSYEDASGKTHIVTDDEFIPSQDVYTTYTVALYSGDNAMSQVRAMADNGANYVNAKTGTLTVRAVQDEPDAVVSAISQDPPKSLESGSAVAVAGASTTYTLNNTGVALPVNDSKPSLLFDGIIDDDDHDRTAALVDAIKAQMNTSVDSECYQAKYLDLVDANNGNAWITASDAVTVYWGYPEGTDASTEFTLYHFKDLHRDGASSGYDVNDISAATIETVKVQNTDKGIKFDVNSGGFSPFVLVWEKDSGGSVTPPATTHTITATAGTGGSISPSGEVSVRDGADQAFTITPDEGNKVRDVVVDGASVGALGSYAFDDVRGDHAISVTFTRGNAPADPDDTGVSDWFETGDHDAFMHGYDDGTGRFGPDDNMTRGEAAQMFYNMLKDKSRGDVQFDFEDLSEGAWYYEAVATMASHGILLGTSPTTVEPERPITRAEFTAMAMRFSKGDLSGENIFTDVSEGDWYYGVIVGSIKYGWISGYDDGTGRFGPNDNITRAQATIIANRMLGRVPDGVYINAHLDELTRFPDVSEDFYAFRDIVEATNSHDYSKDGGFEHWSRLR